MRRATRMALMADRNRGYNMDYPMPRGGDGRSRPMYHYDDRHEPEPVYMDARRRDSRGRFVSEGDGHPQMGYPPYRDHTNYYEPTYEFDVRGTSTRRDNVPYSHAEAHKMTRQDAEAWVHGMRNEDGSSGGKWDFEQAKKLMAQRAVKCEPVEFYAALNMMYSDYGQLASRYGASPEDFCCELAKAFLMDKDAKPNKLDLYRHYIANA